MVGVMLETDVDSFILRFVQVRDAEQRNAAQRNATQRNAQEKSQSTGLAAAPWHGIIRHVQSNEELRFTQIEDALRFVANYVELADGILAQDDSK